MLDLFGKLFPLIIVLCVAGLGAFLWNIIAMEKFKKVLLAEAEQKKSSADLSVRPKTIEQYRSTPDRNTFIKYISLVDNFEKLGLSGKMSVTSTELASIKSSISSLYFVLYKAEFKTRVYFTLGLWLIMIPLSFWLLVVLGALWIFSTSIQTKNLTRFESLLNQYYSPQFNDSLQASNATATPKPSSISSEIQKLEEMRVSGVISDDEFTQLKKKIISS